MKCRLMDIPGSAVAVLVAAAFCFSCVSKRHADIISARNDSLQVSVYEREQVYGELFGALNRLTAALTEAQHLEDIVRTNISHGSKSERAAEELYDNIHRLAELMVRCRAEMQIMQRGIDRLGARSPGISHLKALISRLQRKVDGHRELVRELRKDIYILPHSHTFYPENGSEPTDSDILSGNEMLHTAYYVIGTYKDLHSRHIVHRAHLFWGQFVVYEDSPLEYFNKVDSRSTTGVYIGKENARIISSHPSGSYHIVERDGWMERIEIDDPRRFWSLSKVLVVAYR